MTCALARKHGFEVAFLGTGKAAVEFALGNPERKVAVVFEEMLTRMTRVFCVATRPRAGTITFTRAI